jgi:hypothetical protein
VKGKPFLLLIMVCPENNTLKAITDAKNGPHQCVDIAIIIQLKFEGFKNCL